MNTTSFYDKFEIPNKLFAMCVDFMYILESKYSDPSNLGSFHFYGPKETHANRQSKFKKKMSCV